MLLLFSSWGLCHNISKLVCVLTFLLTHFILIHDSLWNPLWGCFVLEYFPWSFIKEQMLYTFGFSILIHWLNLGNIVSDQSKETSGPSSPTSKRGFNFGTFVRRAASVASVAAKHAYAAAAATRGPDDEMLPLKCCLMSISLPWEHIAHDLLFKVRFKS